MKARSVAFAIAAPILLLFGSLLQLLILLVFASADADGMSTAARWSFVIFIAAVSYGYVRLLVSLWRRMHADALGEPERPDESGGRKPLTRLAACILFTVVLGGWYSERASHSGYAAPPLDRAERVTGVLGEPSSRPRYQHVVLVAGDSRMALGCNPNERYPSDCLARDLHRKLAGTTMTAYYFSYPDALRSERVLLQLTASDGREVVRYADQVRELSAARVRDSRRTWQSTIPFSIVIALLIWPFTEVVAVNEAAKERRRRKLDTGGATSNPLPASAS
jgi:hypothetical protein